MKAVVLTGHGGLNTLEWREEVLVPQPEAGEVLIRVGVSAVNNTDVNTRTGWYSKAVRGETGSAATEGYAGASDADGAWSGALSFPRIQGADCCDEIVAVGEGVEAAWIGAAYVPPNGCGIRCACDLWLRTRRWLCRIRDCGG